MSQREPGSVTCPRCAATWPAPLFRSVDADTIPVQLDAILDGSFERTTCPGCSHAFRPEHALLFVSHAHRLWIVMLPPSDRPRYAALERGVEHRIRGHIARAAPVVARRLAGVRPRLVFGQHMLTEAVRVGYAGLDPGVVECAKLLAVRRNLAAVMHHGPFELCVERLDSIAPRCAVHRLPAGERVAELALDRHALVEASQPALAGQFPDLFQRPYVSATRYLLGDTV